MAVSYAWDAANNLTRLTYPDGWAVDYVYDALNRVTDAVDNNGTGARTLASVGYDALSRRDALTYANGASARYGYSARGDLTCLDWNLTGAAPGACNAGTPEIAYDFTYNGVGQTLTETVSDPLLRWAPSMSLTDTYAVNGLNQYTSVAGVSVTHDANGNLTADHRGQSYTYDAENVLRSASGLASGTATYSYYADGTRSKKSYNAAVSKFYYTGDQEIYETDGSDAKLRRYVRLPGSIDEALLMIDYTLDGGCNDNNYANCEIWAHQNRLGSVVATSDDAGAVTDRFTYSPYGVSGGSSAGFPFRFTGQKLDPETGLYYYKARYYDSEVGRFMQTDPIGYEDQMDLYAYVHNDPVNGTDPSGRDTAYCSTQGRGDDKELYCILERNKDPDSIILDNRTIKKFEDDGDLSSQGWVELLKAVGAEFGHRYLTLDERRFSREAVDALINIVSSIPLPATRTAAGAARVQRATSRNNSRSRRTDGDRCCFVAGTLIQTKKGLVPIEKLDVGDFVLSRDVETGETELKPVTSLIRRHNRVIWEVETVDVAGAIETFRTTDDHPWWVVGRGWINTRDLDVGMEVSTADDHGVIIKSVEQTQEVEPTFNLEVADFHTYFVGYAEVLVHNCDDHYRERRNERRPADPSRIKREGRKYHDTETGNTVYVRGDDVYIESPDGNPVTQFTNSRANTLQRVQDGRWVPAD